MRVRVIGDTTRLSARFQKQIVELETASAKNDGLNLQIAINYGSRDEMIRAMKKMYHDMENGTRQVSELNEDLFASYLDTAGIPDPDLLIRTSGEQRNTSAVCTLSGLIRRCKKRQFAVFFYGLF